MFLKLRHQEMNIYQESLCLVKTCYAFTSTLPKDERFGLISQIRRAALSVHLNFSEGASRQSDAERKRYYQIARGSLIEIDAALDVAVHLDLTKDYNLVPLGGHLEGCFKMLTGMLR